MADSGIDYIGEAVTDLNNEFDYFSAADVLRAVNAIEAVEVDYTLEQVVDSLAANKRVKVDAEGNYSVR